MADKTSDLAFIQISGRSNLPYLEYADSEKIEPMEELISLGYPFGLELSGVATVIKGRFVALRKVKEMGVKLVQTDMTINPGASGGPIIKEAFDLLSTNYTSGNSFDNWKDGYKNTLSVTLYKVQGIGDNQVSVKFSSTDLIDEEVVYKYFEGILTVKKINGKLKIDNHEIKEISEPDWEWFFE